MTRITINGISLDPVTYANAGLMSATSAGSNYILIQATAPLTADQKEQLATAGVTIHEYVSENTYLAAYQSDDLAKLRGLPFVAWADVYMKGFKVPPNLRPHEANPAAWIAPPAPAPSLSNRLRMVDVVFHEDVDPSSVDLKKRLAAAARVNPDGLPIGRRKVRLTVEERFLDDLASIDEVRLIQEVQPVSLRNNVARVVVNAHVNVAGTVYQGDGEVVAIADTGFDLGDTVNVHPAFTGRVARLYALGRPSPANADDPHSHGTHVCGSAVGDGTSSTMGGAIQGTAPRARLVVQSLLDSGGGLGGIPADLTDLFLPPYRDDGARVHSNSWGASIPSLPYSPSSQEIDQFVWDHQDCVIVFGAGNDGIDGNSDGAIDAGQVGSEAAAKNCITVGASENNRPRLEGVNSYGDNWPSDFPANPINDDRMADNPNGMVAFSSRGPTRERRFKPDIVAPGTCILSTLSRRVSTPPTDYGTSSDSAFFFDGGTSMAAPLVTGAVAVLRESLVKNGTATPSAALLKALVINGAVGLTGQYTPTEAGASPNNNSGWGRLNLSGSVIIPGPNADGGFGDGAPLKEGEETSIDITVPPRRETHGTPVPTAAGPTAGGPTLKVTLVWSDPPGANLQNDLDLIVATGSGLVRHGNMGSGSGFDTLNNVEQVLWENIPPGDVKITVRATRITRFAQPWAYVWRVS
jgi:hypothetical protein